MDPELIRRAQAGDVESFDALISARLPQMTRTAMAILGHEADARDAVAETIAAVWRELPRLREVDAFGGGANASSATHPARRAVASRRRRDRPRR